MALMFHRRLAIPLWAIAFFTVALAALPPATLLLMPPATLFVLALAIAVVVFAMPGAFPWLGPSRSLARVGPSIHRDEASAGSAIDGGICVRTPDEPKVVCNAAHRVNASACQDRRSVTIRSRHEETRVTNKAAFRP
jgi:hypothetical protein